VTHWGDISTTGDFANGIYAESIDDYLSVEHTGNITTTGRGAFGIHARADSGNVTVTHWGDITATGEDAVGIYVISDRDDGEGTITVTQTGNITAGKTAIEADADDADSNIVITLDSGEIYGGTTGVHFHSGGANKLTIGKSASLSGGTADFDTGYAIHSNDTGNLTIDNYGTVTGNVYLENGNNAFNNYAGAVFNSGLTVNLGAGNRFTNAGDWSVFGDGVVGTTTLTGDLVQTDTGRLIVDIDDDEADRINVTGTAKLAGTIVVGVMELPTTRQGEFTIVSATLRVTDDGLLLLSSPALHAVLLFPNTNNVALSYDVDFVIADSSPGPDGNGSFSGFNRSQTAIAAHLTSSYGDGTGGLAPVFQTLLNLVDPEDHKTILDQLSPEVYGATQIAAFYASRDFSDNLLSCRVNGTTTASINREGQCLWVGAKARFLDHDRTSENIGFDETAGLFAAGAQVALDPVWRLGFGVGYQNSSLDTDTGATSDSDQVQGGVALKYNPGALLLAGVVSGGRGWYDTTRSMAFGNFAETAQGKHEIDVLAGRLHASYVFGAPSGYFKPLIDAAVTRLDLGDVTETGAGGVSLIVHGDDNTVFSVSPALEFGTQWWLGNGTLVRPFVRAGATWFSDDNVTVSASFAGTPDGVDPFTILAEMDQVQADVAAGVEMINVEGSALRFYYDGHFGDTVEIHSVGLKGSAAF
jgi:uncharacterized protein with beta-barrel porin domain